MATIQEIRRDNIGANGVVLTVTGVDNELTVAFNGVELVRLTGPPLPQPHQENLTGQIVAGKANVLVVSLVNFRSSGFNPTSCNAVLNVGGEEINLNFSTNGPPEGLVAQFIVVLQR